MHERAPTRSAVPVRGVVFDVDGLLLATEQIYTEAMREVLRRYGKRLDPAFKQSLTGREAQESSRRIVAEYALPISPGAFLDERNALLRQRFPAAEAKPGAREWVEHFHAHGVPQAVATSSSRELFELKSSRHRDWFARFDHILSVEDPGIGRGKPAPDVFLAAARALGLPPEQCLAFEDSPAGVAAALAAGMPVIAVPEPPFERAPFAEASAVLDSLVSFDPQPWGLPALA